MIWILLAILLIVVLAGFADDNAGLFGDTLYSTDTKKTKEDSEHLS